MQLRLLFLRRLKQLNYANGLNCRTVSSVISAGPPKRIYSTTTAALWTNLALKPIDFGQDIEEVERQHFFQHEVLPMNTLEDVALYLHGDRETANQRFQILVDNGPTTVVETTLFDILNNELFHVEFVRKVTTILTGRESDHDWSKDLFYMVTAATAYTLKRMDLVKDIVESEIERHFQSEAHHPENVDYTRILMTDEQILEMAVDRLSRSLQFNRGVAHLTEMEKYEPF
ncbi:hypothetical protein CAPTEDRAFT_227569 [Capitella teleta]|uniref:Uncharacterized protein n=1 Tax=Capitella teleta TaxID=283909 RepID=R7TPE0_CAPTE|nr:hypothetical protein CAPTEDRAFT_227569 [Capitella teleta]|eukprot:ELT93366.1 hypothetical protein CAPTEDRAFT_227569 [Capitella teleta]